MVCGCKDIKKNRNVKNKFAIYMIYTANLILSVDCAALFNGVAEEDLVINIFLSSDQSGFR